MSYRDLRSKRDIPTSGSVFYHLKFAVLTSTISSGNGPGFRLKPRFFFS